MNLTNQEILEQIKGGLIVSCQALETEPLHSSYIMSRMAYAAMLGGAVGIRANTIVLLRLKKTCRFPLLALLNRIMGIAMCILHQP